MPTESSMQSVKTPLSFRQKLLGGEFALMTKTQLYWLLGLLAIVLAAILWVVFSIIEPPPPKKLRIATGGTSGAYYGFGERYAAKLAEHGIKLEVLPSAGSIDNLKRILDPNSGVDIALIQSGVSSHIPELAKISNDDDLPLESLASVSFEPVWVFYKPRNNDDKRSSLATLNGKRIAIGPEGSGTRVVALRLLSSVDIDSKSAALLDTNFGDAVDAVMKGDIDAAFVVASASAPAIQKALNSGLRPINFQRADAYVRLNPWLSKVTLPRGVIDMGKDIPDDDLNIVASSANLVVRKDLHPAISFLLMDIATELHRAPTILNAQREFPNEKNLEFPQSSESKRFFKTGRPFLQRYLPFWLANLFERLLVTLVPVLAIGIPALQLLPKAFLWMRRSNLLKMYDKTRLLESNLQNNDESRRAAIDQLNLLETELKAMPPDSDLFIEIYNLRGHIELVRNRIAK